MKKVQILPKTQKLKMNFSSLIMISWLKTDSKKTKERKQDDNELGDTKRQREGTQVGRRTLEEREKLKSCYSVCSTFFQG